MNRSKILLLSLIVMFTGCAANTDETSSVTTAVTTTTAAVTTTTTAATTQAATTSAQTTAVTEKSEPVETTVVTTTVATTTASSTTTAETEIAVNEQAEPEMSEQTKTPDGKYNMADTDIVNSDGTYTQALGSCDTVFAPSFLAEVSEAWSGNNERFDSGRYDGKKSNPSKIPYSEITAENAAEAFPYLGFIGYVPDYIEILPTDSYDIVAGKVWKNLVGTSVAYDGGHTMDNYPGHYFKTEAEYNQYLADMKAERAAADAADQEAFENIANGTADPFKDSDEDILNIINSRR